MTHRTIDFSTHDSDDFHVMWNRWCLAISELDPRVENTAVLAREAAGYVDQMLEALTSFVESKR